MSEGTYGFSYLKLIKESGGEAIHCGDGSYSEFMTRMVEKARKPNIEIPAPQEIEGAIVRVEVNGEELEFNVSDDGKTILLKNVETSLDIDNYEITIYEEV